MIKTKIQFSCEFYLLMISSNFNPDNVMAKKKKSFSGKEHKKSLMSALKKKKKKQKNYFVNETNKISYFSQRLSF